MVESDKFNTSKEIFDYYKSITPRRTTKFYIASWILFVFFLIVDITSIVVVVISDHKIDSIPRIDYAAYEMIDKLIAINLAFEIILILGSVLLLVSIGMIIGSKADMKEKHIQRVFSQMPPEAKTRYDHLKLAEEQEALKKECDKLEKELEELQKHPEHIITRTVIIGHDSQMDMKSAIKRGIIGGALLGDIGAMGGMLSAKQKVFTTFLVYYKDGHTETDEVENGSQMYNIYISYLDV